jgi:glyoxylase-like metal-dependent hydrolase (beta-lactamase superfamily II)
MLEIKGMHGIVYPTLAWDNENLVLVDAGFPGQKDAIVESIAAAGFSAEKLTHILLTHQDIDHIGCVLDLLSLASAAKVLAHTDEAPYIDGRKTSIKLAMLLNNQDTLPPDQREWRDKLKVAFANRRIPIDKELRDGKVLPICGGITVIHTPGHTPGHICLFINESRILVAGDALNIVDGKLAGSNPQHTQNKTLALQSAQKAMAYPFDAVVSYHCGYYERVDVEG